MIEHLSVVTRKGQVTLPAEIRKMLDLKRGDKVAFCVQGDRVEILRSARSVAQRTFGSIAPRKRPEDFRELRQLAEDDIAEQALAETVPTFAKPE